jgi:hypothetical protein
MPSLFAQPYFRGTPLGTLTFYQTGTLTPQTIFANTSGTPLANPVTADAEGRFVEIYLGDGVTYRVIERDAAGVILADVDPVNPPLALTSLSVSGAITSGSFVEAQTPATGTLGGFRLKADATTGFGYFGAQASDGLTQWGNWRYDSTGVARWSGTLEIVGTALFGGNVTVNSLICNGRAYTAPDTLTVAATTTIDCSLGNVFTAAMTVNITTLTVSNAVAGQTINVLFTQDGTGSRTVAWPASFRWAGGVAPTLSTAAAARDLLVATFDGTVWYASLGKGFA